MSDRGKCQICGEPVAGGADQVFFLLSPFHSFHHVKHLQCHDAAEREACAKLVDDECARVLSKQDGRDDSVDLKEQK